MSPFLVFPYRLETIPVLNWAMNQHHSWKTKVLSWTDLLAYTPN